MLVSRSALVRVRRFSVHRPDAALAAGLFALVLLEAGLAVGAQRPWALAVVPALTLPLAWRRSHPAMVALIVTAALAVQEAWEAITLFEQTFTGFVCVIVGAYSLGRHAGRRALVLAGAGCAVTAGLAIGLNDSSGASGVIASALVLAPVAAGRAVLARVGLREQLEKQAQELEATAGVAAEAEATEERARIALELQDVVSHRVSEMVVQAQVARHLAEREPGRATTAIAFVEARGRDALDEMRRLLGVLRRGDEAVALAPLPTLARLGALVQSTRDRGHAVELVAGEEPPAVPPGLDVAAYRVIEQALLEATKRSGDGPVTIRVTHDRRWLELEVAREQAASAALATGATDAPRRMIGIRERVAAFGGELEAGDRDDGAYHLRARLPDGREPQRRRLVARPGSLRERHTRLGDPDWGIERPDGSHSSARDRAAPRPHRGDGNRGDNRLDARGPAAGQRAGGGARSRPAPGAPLVSPRGLCPGVDGSVRHDRALHTHDRTGVVRPAGSALLLRRRRLRGEWTGLGRGGRRRERDRGPRPAAGRPDLGRGRVPGDPRRAVVARRTGGS